VVIGTPGRVADHLRRGTLDLTGVHFFCLDEADEMLNMGFLDDVEWILEHAPETRQIALFSATLPPPIRRVAKKHLHDPADVRIERKTRTVEQTEQASLRLPRHGRAEALERLLGVEEHDAVLVFVGTQRAAAELAEHLQSRGVGAECIHGGMNQVQRDTVVKRLREKRIQVVVATDVAARGLDVDHIGLVVNYDLPRDPEVYVHRIGRTGRAGRAGRAISFWNPRQLGLMRSIERFSGQRMQPMQLPGVEELRARRRERMVEKLTVIAAEEPDAFVAWAQEIAETEGLDAPMLAAAALKLAWGDEPLHAVAAADGTGDIGEMVEIVIPVGLRDRVRPGAIVAAIAGESGLPGRVVGRINVQERVTFAEVAAQHVPLILEKLDGVRIAGRTVKPRLAHPEGGRPPRRGGKGKPQRPSDGRA
jgi:ATP-dependent RNA helicase DeaD